MSTEAMQILEAIQRLPLSDKLLLVELILRKVKEEITSGEWEEEERRKAAEVLLADYREDEELTAFTIIDQEGFYEAK